MERDILAVRRFVFSTAQCSKHRSKSGEASGESSAEKIEFISFCAETAHATASLGIAYLRDRRLIRSLSAFSLANEDQVNENA
jgi:hypothetical protein